MGSEQEFASHHHLQPTQAGNLSPGRRLEGNASSVGRETMVTAKSKMDRLRSRSSMRKEGSIRLIAVGEHTELPSQSTNLTDSFTRRAETEARSITLGRFEKSDLGNKLKEIPKFDISEIMLGKRLGRGGFSNVDEIRGFVLVGNGQRQPRTTLPPIRSFSSRLGKITRSDTVAVDDKESRKFIADHCHRNSGDARYAIKMLRKDILESESRIALGLCDLAIESRFLAHLAHPNIIKLRAISSAEPCSGKYFVILDRLRDTLAKRVETWNATYTRLYSFWGRLRDRGGKKRLDFYESRIEKAFDLSSAIDHCHAFNIVHRDIKPDNIGFDVRGDIKIFDFGLATELHCDERLQDGTFNLTGMTGSLRFMAPEVWMKLPYSSACDMYSLSIVLWSIVSLKKPYNCKWTNEQHFADEVLCPNGKRPEIGSRWPRALNELLTSGWAHDQLARLSAKEMTKGLRAELVRLRHGDESDIPDHKRRRSTFIFEPRRGSRSRSGKEDTGSFTEFLDRSVKSQNSLHQSFASLGHEKDPESKTP